MTALSSGESEFFGGPHVQYKCANSFLRWTSRRKRRCLRRPLRATRSGSTVRNWTRQCTHTPASVHLCNMTSKRRGIAKILLGQFREIAELNDVGTIGGDFNMSAFREHGKSKLC